MNNQIKELQNGEEIKKSSNSQPSPGQRRHEGREQRGWKPPWLPPGGLYHRTSAGCGSRGSTPWRSSGGCWSSSDGGWIRSGSSWSSSDKIGRKSIFPPWTRFSWSDAPGRGAGLDTFRPSGLFQTGDDRGPVPLDEYVSIGLHSAFHLNATVIKNRHHHKRARATMTLSPPLKHPPWVCAQANHQRPKALHRKYCPSQGLACCNRGAILLCVVLASPPAPPTGSPMLAAEQQSPPGEAFLGAPWAAKGRQEPRADHV